jgi:hypothetical protein
LVKPLKGLVSEVAPTLKELNDSFEASPNTNKTLTRINRDMRFAKGQSPYKDHVLVLFYRVGRKIGSFHRTLIHFSLVLICLVSIFQASETLANHLTAQEIIQRVDEREDGEDVEWDMVITLINRLDEKRTRTAKLFRKDFVVKGQRQTRQVTVFLSPRNIRSVGMLSFDYKHDAGDDDMWLYLPAIKKLRRIPAADRGDNFVGTDFTYEDIKQGFAVDDYHYRLIEETIWGDENQKFEVYRIEAIPKTEALKSALGFNRAEILVRKDIFIQVEQRFFDKNNALTRINSARDIRKIQGIWTAMRLESYNILNNHRTVLEITRAVYDQGLKDGLFHQRTLISERIR